jgi:hypothetical protein
MPQQPPQSTGRKTFYNSGLLSRNARQKENPELPTYTGNVNVRCPHCNVDSEFWLNGEVKDGQYGKFFGLRLNPKKPKAGPKAPIPAKPKKATPPPPEPDVIDDDDGDLAF